MAEYAGDLEAEEAGAAPMDSHPAEAGENRPKTAAGGAPGVSQSQAPSSSGEAAGSVSDLFRKALVTGLGAAVMTEEGVRSLIRELKIPRETVNAALGQAERGREAIRRAVGDEARRFLDSPALKKEISRALSKLTIEMTVRIRLNPDGTGPDISFSQPRIRREPSSPSPSTLQDRSRGACAEPAVERADAAPPAEGSGDAGMDDAALEGSR